MNKLAFSLDPWFTIIEWTFSVRKIFQDVDKRIQESTFDVRLAICVPERWQFKSWVVSYDSRTLQAVAVNYDKLSSLVFGDCNLQLCPHWPL